MRWARRVLAGAILSGIAVVPVLAEEVRLVAADGVTVFADHFAPSGTRSRGTILLFHQASSSAAEYMTIAPRLAAMGFVVLAVDLRSGGEMFLGTNRTVQALGFSAGYEAALPDMAAALASVQAAGPVLVWGSSYSAGLVFALAAAHPGSVAAILAFSPGEYFSAINVAQAAAQVRVPVYVTSASVAGEVAAAKAIADAVPGGMAVQFVPKVGSHGSATLRADTDPKGEAANWDAVTGFLDRVAP